MGGAALGGAAKRLLAFRKSSPGDRAMRRLTGYFIVPVWIGAGFIDYLWHRHTKIETTSGLEESLMHSIMMVEAAPAVMAALFLEINPGVLAGMIWLSALHELTVLWDLWYTAPRRAIPAGEQVTHTFLEAPPFLTTAAAIATHWEEFLELAGRGRRRPNMRIRLQRPMIHPDGVVAIFGHDPAWCSSARRRTAALHRGQKGRSRRAGYARVPRGSLFVVVLKLDTPGKCRRIACTTDHAS